MEYQIEGAPLPVVICQLEAGETMLTERGSMSWMTPNMKMETSTNGGLGKAFGRMLSGDSIFQNRYKMCIRDSWYRPRRSHDSGW